jgi:uncharacterized protein
VRQTEGTSGRVLTPKGEPLIMTANPDPERAMSNADADSEPIIIAELAHGPMTDERPVWTPLVVSGGAIFLSAAISGMLLIGAALWHRGPEAVQDMAVMMSWLREFGQTREGLLLLVLPSQSVFLLVACAAAALSPRPFVQRLSLGAGVAPFWTWVVFAVGTPVVGIASSTMLSLLVDELGENLEFLESLMRSHVDQSLPLLFVLVAVVPGLFEELLFRGYLQTRLAERWSPVGAVTVSAVIFAAAHLDPLHGLGVLPLGLWLGAVAWRCGSVWPAVFCHTINNAAAILGVKFQPENGIQAAIDTFTLTTLIICTPAFLLSLALFRNRSAREA